MKNIILLFLLCGVVDAAMIIDDTATPRFGRAQIIDIMTSRKQRSDEITSFVNTLGVKHSLAVIDPVTFGFLKDAAGDNMIAVGAGGVTVTSADNPWAAGDVGKTIDIAGAGPGNTTLRAAITVFNNAGSVTIDTAASVAVVPTVNSSAGHAIWGWSTWGQERFPLISNDGATNYFRVMDATTPQVIYASNLTLTDTDWTDWQWAGQGVNPPGPIAAATIDQIGATGVYCYKFINGDAMAFHDLQIRHNYAEGTDIPMHIHWTPSTTAVYTGTWTLKYCDWLSTSAGAAMQGPTTITATFNAAVTATQQQYSMFNNPIAGAGRKISSTAHAILTLSLTAGASCFLNGLDGHYQIDRMGSRTPTTK